MTRLSEVARPLIRTELAELRLVPPGAVRLDAAFRRWAEACGRPADRAAGGDFVAQLAVGAIGARIMLATGAVGEIDAAWFLGRTLEAALNATPAIYVDAAELDAWLSAVAARRVPAHEARYAALVAFLRDRLPPAPQRPPSQAQDVKAVQARFGAEFGRDLIRGARRDAYRDRMPTPGKPS